MATFTKFNKSNGKLVKNMRAALEFAQKYPGWHSFNAKDKATVDAIVALGELKLVSYDLINEQFALNKEQISS